MVFVSADSVVAISRRLETPGIPRDFELRERNPDFKSLARDDM